MPISPAGVADEFMGIAGGNVVEDGFVFVVAGVAGAEDHGDCGDLLEADCVLPGHGVFE